MVVRSNCFHSMLIVYLAKQVKHFGGLAHTSVFVFESFVHFVQKKAHGSKHMTSEVAYWIEVQSMMETE